MSKKEQASTRRTPREINVGRVTQVGKGAQPLSGAGPKPSRKPGTGTVVSSGSGVGKKEK